MEFKIRSPNNFESLEVKKQGLRNHSEALDALYYLPLHVLYVLRKQHSISMI